MDGAALFGSNSDLTAAQECARAVVVFVYGLALVRIAGRRVFGKWSALDVIASIVIGSNLSRALTGNAQLFGTLAATTLLFALHWLFAQAAARSRPLSALFEGRAVDLVRDGRIDETARRRHGVSHADLDEAIRKRGLRDVDDVAKVLLEPSGAITIIPRDA